MNLHRMTFFFVLFLSFTGVFAETLNEAEINDLFSQAKAQFQEANRLAQSDPVGARDIYRKAALRFERIVRDGGIQNGKLFYNIGNAYYLMDDLGRAIVNYRRAEMFIPNDPNLQQNLEAARARRLDEISETQQTKVLKTLFFWHYDVSTKSRFLVFGTFFVLLWLAASARLFVRRSALTWIIAISTVTACLFLASLVVEEISRQQSRPGVILAHEVVARKGDSQTYEQSFKKPLHAGTEFELVETRGTWVHVELADGRRCWLPEKDVELVR